MAARVEHLVGQGAPGRQRQRVVFARDLLETLRGREVEATATRVAASASEGEPVAGIYRRRLDLASGRASR
jgi:hypothetical protein